MEILLELPHVISYKPFGFHLPTSGAVHARKYLMDCRAFANVKSQTCERLTVFSLQLPQEPWVPENSLNAPFLQF